MVQDMTEDRIAVEHFVDMRYESQDSTLTIPLEGLDVLAEDFQSHIENRFSEAHQRRYGHATPGAPVQYVALRTTGLGTITRADARVEGNATGGALVDTLPVYFDGIEQATAFIDRGLLSPGDTFTGPAIVFEPTSTTVVPPRCTCTVDDNEFILMTVPASAPDLALATAGEKEF